MFKFVKFEGNSSLLEAFTKSFLRDPWGCSTLGLDNWNALVEDTPELCRERVAAFIFLRMSWIVVFWETLRTSLQ